MIYYVIPPSLSNFYLKQICRTYNQVTGALGLQVGGKKTSFQVHNKDYSKIINDKIICCDTSKWLFKFDVNYPTPISQSAMTDATNII